MSIAKEDTAIGKKNVERTTSALKKEKIVGEIKGIFLGERTTHTMKDQKEQPVYSYGPLNEADFVRRFKSNHPKDALAKHEIAAAVRYLKAIIKGKYGAYFSQAVQDDLAEDALIEIVTSRQGFKDKARLTTWMGTIACRVAYRHFEANFKKRGGSDTNRFEAPAYPLEDKDPLEDEEKSEAKDDSTKDGSGAGADKPGAAHIIVPVKFPIIVAITVSSDAPDWRETPDKTNASDTEIEDIDFWLLLEEAQSVLTRKEAKAFQAIVVRQGDYKQYAAQEDMTVTAVRSLVSDAKKKLRIILTDQFGF